MFFNGKSEKGYELWKSDGTQAGTVLVKDVLPGSDSADPQNFVNVNGTLFFEADDGLRGRELWKSDGTSAGTILVKDIQPGISSSKIANFKSFNGDLYFTREREQGNLDLWRSDGSDAGTYLIKSDVVFGSAAWLNGFLFFSAYSNGAGFELWKTDGTAAGSSLVKDIEPGVNPSAPNWITTIGDKIYFTARTAIHGSELWISDGTDAGTNLVEDLVPGSGSIGAGFLTELNGKLYFTGTPAGLNDHTLYVSDGTTDGTGQVKRIINSLVNSIVRVGTTLYLGTYDMATSKRVLWKSDGTPEGTTLIKVFTPGITQPLRSFANSNGTLFFIAQKENELGNDPQIWKTDGTLAGTVMVTDIPHQLFNYGTVGVYNLMAIGNTLYFVSDDDVNGNEVWKMDNAELIPRLLTNTTNGTYNSDTHGLTDFNGSLYFSAIDIPSGWELWKSDGTTGGTNIYRDLAPGSNSSKPTRLLSADNKLFFVTTGTNGGFWKSDGTLGGTVKFSLRPYGTTEYRYVNGKLFFTRDSPVELWQIEPVSGNAARATGPGITNTHSLTVFKDELCFIGYEGSTSWLMKTDGTAAGTSKIILSNAIQKLYSAGNLLYFAANDGINGRELWKTDGTAGGTSMVKDVNPGAGYSLADNEPFQIQHIDNTAYFVADDGVHGFELWKTNGSAAGTSLVKDINTGVASSSIFNLTNVNGILYFVADDGVHGQELWKSDGTVGGTVMIMDINVGAYNATPENLLSFKGVLYFSAYDGVIRTLWKSNGKPCGTLKATNNVHVIAGGKYKEIYAFKNRIYITGSTPETGEELYFHDTANDPAISDACKSAQSITFNLTPAHVFGEAAIVLDAVSTSGLPVQYISSNPAVATVSGNTVTILKSGTATITARQSGNQNFSAASDIDQLLTISKAEQTITFAGTNTSVYGSSPFMLNAAATSNQPIEYSSSDPAIVSIVGNVATILKAGSVNISANQSGDDRYLPAAQVVQIVTVAKANQVISFPLQQQATFGDAPITLNALSTSGLPINYTSSDPSILLISGNVATILKAGSANITARQDGNENINLQEVVKPIIIGKANQVIMFDAIDPKVMVTIRSI